MDNKTVKQLQKLCRDAGLKTSGNKQALIDRLEYRSAHTTLEHGLLNRIQDLENTVAQLRTHSSSNSEAEDDDASAPRIRSFAPNIISSPRTNMTSTASVMNSAPATNQIGNQVHAQGCNVQQFAATTTHQTEQPVNSSQYPSVPQYTGMPQYTSVPQYTGMPQYTSVPQHIGMPQYSNVPQYTGMFQCTGGPQRIGVPQAAKVSTGHSAQTQSAPWAPAMSIKDIIAVLPEYDPATENSLTSIQFVQRIQMLMYAYHWRDDTVIFAAQQKLSCGRTHSLRYL